MLVALVAWLGVGVVSETLARSDGGAALADPGRTWAEPYDGITPGQIAGIRFDDLPDDGGFVTPLAKTLDSLDGFGKKRIESLRQQLSTWPAANVPDIAQRVRNLLSVAAIADLSQDPNEGEIAFVVEQQIRATVREEDLPRVLAWVVLNPKAGTVLTDARELGIRGPADEAAVRERSAVYAKKFLRDLSVGG